MITRRRCRSKGLEHQKRIAKKIPQSYVTLQTGDIESFHRFWERLNMECKHQEKLNVWAAIEQAMRDMRAKGKDAWAVIFTRNYEKKDYIIMDLDFVIELVELAGKKK